MNKNKSILMLTMLENQTRNLKYYENLIDRIKQTYYNKIDVVIVVATQSEFNFNYEFEKTKCAIYFGVNENSFNSKFSQLPSDKIIFCANKGYDVGPFLIGCKHIENQYEYIIHIHAKTNDTWNKLLTTIANCNITELDVDTIIPNQDVPGLKTLTTTDTSDGNYNILDSHRHLFPFYDTSWEYSSGKMFATKMQFLKPLLNNFDKIYSLLTDKNKNDVYWQTAMNNTKLFNKYYNEYLNNDINKPISKYASFMRQKYKCRNYFELLNKGYRGIPDLQIEHAIERYLGYLICRNKKLHFSE